MLKNTLIILSLVFLTVSASSAKSELQPAYLDVTGFDYTMGGKPAVSISIGKSINDYYSITIHRDKIKANMVIKRDKEHTKKIINASATIDNKNYQFSLYKGSNSVILVKLKELNHKKKEAVIDVYLKLVDVPTQKYVIFNKNNIKITGTLFDNLVKR